MADTEDTDNLKLKVKRLLNDISFEKRVNSVLDDIRNYAIILANNCKCDQNLVHLNKFNDLNIIYTEMKASRNKSCLGIQFKIFRINYLDIYLTAIEEKRVKDVAKEAEVDITCKTTNNNDSDEETIVDISSIKEVIEEEIDESVFIKLENNVKPSKTMVLQEPKVSNEEFNDEEANDSTSEESDLMAVCEDCEEFFDSKHELKEHKGSVHRLFKSQCLDCPMEFDTDLDLEIHINRDHKQIGLKGKRSVGTSSGKGKADGRVEKSNLSKLKAKCQMKAKLRSRTPLRKSGFRCLQCKKSFRRKGNYDIHLIRDHRKEKPHISCKKCPKKFYTKDSLMNHLSLQHKERVFKCNECSYKTISKQNLTTHMARHLKKRPFQCDQDGCDTKFKVQLDLVKHRRSVHHSNKTGKGVPEKSKRGRKPKQTNKTNDGQTGVVCKWPNCSRRFGCDQELREHVKSHNFLICGRIGCRFQTDSLIKLSEHKLIEKH